MFKMEEAVPQKQNMRDSILWLKIMHLIKTITYAGKILGSLAEAKDHLKLTDMELHSIHGGYDNMIMWSAAGYSIRGEETDAVKYVADAVYKNFDLLVVYFPTDIIALLTDDNG